MSEVEMTTPKDGWWLVSDESNCSEHLCRVSRGLVKVAIVVGSNLSSISLFLYQGHPVYLSPGVSLDTSETEEKWPDAIPLSYSKVKIIIRSYGSTIRLALQDRLQFLSPKITI